MAVPDVAAGAMQRVVRFAELRRHVRRGEQLSLKVVRPRVIRALNAIDEMAFGVRADPRAPMTAHVEHGVYPAGAVARDDQALVADRAREEIACIRNLVGAPGADPACEIQALELRLVERRIGVEMSRQRLVHTDRKSTRLNSS